jgi:outer membrane protein assembly factor BamB
MRIVLAIVAVLVATSAGAEDWPAWRGPAGTGHSSERGLPLVWSPTKNVCWKTPLPGPGNSTPVVSRGRVFLTQATEGGKKRALYCLDAGDGSILWQRTVECADREPTHDTNPYCSASPATDGRCVIVSFGSAGLACYDFEGRQRWRRDFGPCHHIWGNAASPVLCEGLVLLNFGPGERTFLAAVDKETGHDVWRAEEPGGKFGGKFGDKGGAEWVGAWSTPVVANLQGRTELIMSWPGALKAYDPSTGRVLWTCQGLGRLVYTSPLVGPALAVRPGGAGDVTQTHRIWRLPSGPQRIGSGVLVGEHIYTVNEPGTFQCLEVKTGKVLSTDRVGAGVWGSLVYADGRLYVANLDGETLVLAAKPTLAILARNPLQERTLASVAVADRALLIRTYKHLWCIRSPDAQEGPKVGLVQFCPFLGNNCEL